MSTRRRTTCRNGFVFVVVMCLRLMVTSARGGSLDAPAAPTNPASAMWTLENIYNVLDTRTTNVAKRAGATAFVEPTGGPTNGTMHTLNEIMTLVTNRAPVQKTGQTNTYVVDDDGNRIGVAWPNPRFTVQSTNTVGQPDDRTNCVLDNLTGLMWARNANIASNSPLGQTGLGGTCTWAQAFDIITNSAGPVNGTTYGGYTDWRLPNVRELYSLVTYRCFRPSLSDGTGTNKWTEALGPFTGVKSDNYWSSTVFAVSPNDNTWYVSLDYGHLGTVNEATTTLYVWPVRGGK